MGAPPPAASAKTTADVGFGGRAERALPPLPPPPENLPFASMNGGQIILRVIIVLGIAYLVATFGGRILHDSACGAPEAISQRFCQ